MNAFLPVTYVDGTPKTVFRGVLHAVISVCSLIAILVSIVQPQLGAATRFHVMKLSSHVASTTLHLAPFRTEQQMHFVARIDAVLIHLSIIGSSAISEKAIRTASGVTATMHGSVVVLASCNALIYTIYPTLYTRCLVIRIALCVLHSALSLTEMGVVCGATPLLMATGASYLLGALCYVAASCASVENWRHRGKRRYWGFHEDFHLLVFVGDVLSWNMLKRCQCNLVHCQA